MAAVALGSIFAAVAAVFLGLAGDRLGAQGCCCMRNQVFAIQNIDAQSDGVIRATANSTLVWSAAGAKPLRPRPRRRAAQSRNGFE
jgi:hypothetical protein